MKRNRLLNRFLMVLLLPLLALSCQEFAGEETGGPGTGTDFASLASSTGEDGGTITIPLRGGSVSESDSTFGGSAVEGEDFELVGVSGEGIEIAIINDSDYETLETIRVQINTTGNSIHTVSIPCDGTDGGGWALEDFAGDWDAVEDYGGGSTYGPYEVTLVQDETDPNRFDFDNFYDSGYDAYIVFDLAAGTVSFPAQNAGGDGSNPGISASTGTFNLCEGTLTINLTYDGGPWTYRFTQH